MCGTALFVLASLSCVAFSEEEGEEDKDAEDSAPADIGGDAVERSSEDAEDSDPADDGGDAAARSSEDAEDSAPADDGGDAAERSSEDVKGEGEKVEKRSMFLRYPEIGLIIVFQM